MQAWRQLGGGVIVAIFSVILVIGGIFLSLAETLPSPATPTLIPPTFPLSFPTPTATIVAILPSETLTETVLPSETASGLPTASQIVLQPTSCTPPSGWIRVIVATGDTVYALAQRYKTSAESLSAANCLSAVEVPAGYALYVPPVPTVTVIPCGPPAGWVKNYIVQPGDTLFRIAVSYNITYPQLQRGNCMGSSTTIYTGQRLWVPNVPTRTPVPGITIIPTFPSETSLPTVTIVPPTDIPTEPATTIPPATFTQTTPITPNP
ncbi:MAG TPA: LysM peptidoglycan-binding domain-containing protein [Anaerolineales bacterium]